MSSVGWVLDVTSMAALSVLPLAAKDLVGVVPARTSMVLLEAGAGYMVAERAALMLVRIGPFASCARKTSWGLQEPGVPGTRPPQ